MSFLPQQKHCECRCVKRHGNIALRDGLWTSYEMKHLCFIQEMKVYLEM